MTFKQTAALYAYHGLAQILQPLVGHFLQYRLKKGKEDATRIHERYGIATQPRPKGKLFWLHAASVGEFMSLMPLIDRLSAYKIHILVTSGTLTSAALAAQRLPEGAIHQFIPLDIPAFVSKFFNHWQPDLAIFTESEIWPNLMWCAADTAVPFGIVNGRMSARSFLRWQNMFPLISAVLSKTDFCLAQTQDDADRFRTLGANDAISAGNLKFDCAKLPFNEESLENFVNATDGRKLWLGASTHEGEEIIIAEAHQQIQQIYPDVLTVIAPRHPNRGAALLEMLQSKGLNVQLRSRAEIPEKTTDIYIADTIGELGLFYRACHAAFIGCSLVEPGGGHNPIEAAQLGTAIFHGPFIGNFISVYKALENTASVQVSSAKDIANQLEKLFSDNRYSSITGIDLQETVGKLGGAADRIMQALQIYVDRPVS